MERVEPPLKIEPDRCTQRTIAIVPTGLAVLSNIAIIAYIQTLIERAGMLPSLRILVAGAMIIILAALITTSISVVLWMEYHRKKSLMTLDDDGITFESLESWPRVTAIPWAGIETVSVQSIQVMRTRDNYMVITLKDPAQLATYLTPFNRTLWKLLRPIARYLGLPDNTIILVPSKFSDFPVDSQRVVAYASRMLAREKTQ